MYAAKTINMYNMNGESKETDNDRIAASKQNFACILRMFKLTLLFFDIENLDTRKMFCARVIFSIFVFSIAIYQNFFLFMQIINNWGKESNIMTMFVLTWSIQATFSMGFLIYWQFNGYINDLLNCLYMSPKIYKSSSSKISKAIIFAIFISTTAVINYFAAVLLYYLYPYLSTIDLETLNTFKRPYLFPLSLGFLVYGFFIWNIVLTFYVIVSIAAYAKLIEFNEELKSIGRRDHHTDVIRYELMQMFMKHIENGKMIRTIDNTFEVYTFVMIGTNIPTTIFSLLSFFKALSDEWFIVIIIGPAIFFCLVELFNLTAVPAMLHQAINQVEKIIYRNSCIWNPYDEKIYQIAFTLVTHVRQANLGISLWGFAVVSKPLILTTISLITTYLALILQLHPTVIQHRMNGSVS